MPVIISLKALKLKRPCAGQYALVRTAFPDCVPVTAKTMRWVLASDIRIGWIVDNLLSPDQKAEYDHAADAAWAEYDHATAWALAEYERVKAECLLKILRRTVKPTQAALQQVKGKREAKK